MVALAKTWLTFQVLLFDLSGTRRFSPSRPMEDPVFIASLAHPFTGNSSDPASVTWSVALGGSSDGHQGACGCFVFIHSLSPSPLHFTFLPSSSPTSSLPIIFLIPSLDFFAFIDFCCLLFKSCITYSCQATLQLPESIISGDSSVLPSAF